MYILVITNGSAARPLSFVALTKTGLPTFLFYFISVSPSASGVLLPVRIDQRFQRDVGSTQQGFECSQVLRTFEFENGNGSAVREGVRCNKMRIVYGVSLIQITRKPETGGCMYVESFFVYLQVA